jgi:iron complex transport system permease protein
MVLSFLSIMIGSYGFMIPKGAILSYRLNRTTLAIIAGSSLAASGASLQALFRNPLADPHLFGISGGCAAGACLAIAISGAQTLILPSVGAILGGFLAFLIMYFYIIHSERNLEFNLLMGVIINSLAASFITALKIILPAFKTQNMLFWLVGNISVVYNNDFLFIVPLWILGLATLWHIKGQLEILSFGVLESQALGINTSNTIQIIIIANCMLIGNVVAFAGLIGFLGLVIPHLIRITINANIRFMLPLSTLAGASLMILFDILSRVSFFIFKTEIPSGALSAFMLSPIFLILLVIKRKEHYVDNP